MKQALAFGFLVILTAAPLPVFAQPPGGGPGAGGRGAGGPGGGRGPGGPGGRGPGGSPMEMLNQMFSDADTNGDGQLSKAEVTAAMEGQRGGMQRGQGGPPPGQDGGQGRMQRGQGRPEGGRAQGGRGQGERGQGEHGPGEHGHGPGERGPGGPPPQPGQVLPDFVAQSLDLDDRQQRQLAALQAEVDKRLAAMLTDEQKQQLAEGHHGPRHEGGPPPREGNDQDRGNGRPQRPQ